MEYTMEELIPVVAELARKYTSGESTSVTYERANQLMAAVLYCIKECGEGSVPAAKAGLSAKEAYRLGYERTVEKVKRAQEKYNAMIVDFRAYGNENYHDTVTRALPGFFQRYDVRFAPQETVISMDYPVLRPLFGIAGIDAVEQYVECIAMEQKFLGRLPEDYVVCALYLFRKDYRKQFFNICEVVLQDILGHMLLGGRIGVPDEEADYGRICREAEPYSREELRSLLTGFLERLIQEGYGGDWELSAYLEGSVEELSLRLKIGAE